MGSLISKSEEETVLLAKSPSQSRTYRPPDVRQKDRFEVKDKGIVVSTFDASIDKVL